MIGWFRKRFKTPIEERNYGLIYALLSGLLFVGTLWAVFNEVEGRRPWKDYQEQYRDLKVRVLNKKGREATSKVNRDDINKIRGELKKINTKMGSKEYTEAQKRIDDLAIEIRDVSQERANLKSEADNRNYLFEHARKLGHDDDANDYKGERTELEGEMAALDKNIAALEAERAKLLAEQITPLKGRKLELEAKRDSIFGTLADLRKKVNETKNMPIRIQQVMLNDFEKTNFGKLQMRADRCQSCHLGIADPVMADTNIFVNVGKGQIFSNKEGAARARKVFGPHPQTDLLLTHPIEKFGCTSCHGGQAMSVDDVDHAHGLEAHWERPLLAGKYVEGSCRSCHEGMYNYGEMQTISNGRKLFTDFGCYGCHEGPSIPDFKEYKVGPSLLDISKKVSPDWAFKWIKNPQWWNEHTRMPNFKFNDEQTEAVVAYLWDASKGSPYAPVSSSVPGGDAARGATVIKKVGCIGCHTIDEFEQHGRFKYTEADTSKMLWPNAAKNGHRVGEGNNFGPDLNKVGSKVSAEWLFDWVKNPKHFSPDSRMPNLRLSDAEAADVTAYLMSKKDPAGVSSASLSHLSDPAWIKKGEGLIREYGCFGCHNIKGMEDEGKVSVQLSDFGKKTAADLYFGYLGELQLKSVRRHFDSSGFPLGTLYQHLKNGEDWFVWTALKMKNSRIFATDAIPQKMPVFNMTDEEAYAMTVALRSFTKSYLPASYVNPMGPQLQPVVDDGRFLVHWNNCVGCHRIEKGGGYVLDHLRAQMNLKGEDINPYGPPNLHTAGSKLQEPWFFAFVRNPAELPVRTWLEIRMPTYGFSPSEISRLNKYFLGLDREYLEFTDYSFYPATDNSLAAGKQLYEKLKCSQCHASGSAPASGGETAVPAPNLDLAGSRLKPDWIPIWLRDPQRVAPGTKMPNFFGTWDEPVAADPDILGGDWKLQVNALRDYVWRIGGSKGFGPTTPGRISDSMSVATPVATPAQQQKKDSAAARNSSRPAVGRKLSMR